MSHFSQNLKLLRECFRYTQRQIADILGTSDSNISKYESGESEVKSYWKNKLARIFDQKVEDMNSRLYTFEEAEELARSGVRYIEFEDPEGEGVRYEKVTLPKAPATVVPVPGETVINADELAKHLGRIIKETLEKHKIPVKTFAAMVDRSPRTMQRIIKGEIMADPGMMITLCQENNESLDIFRTKPLSGRVKYAQTLAMEILKERGRRF